MLALIYRAGGMDGSRHIYVHICVLFSHATRLKVSIKAENETRKLSQIVIFDFFLFQKETSLYDVSISFKKRDIR